MAYGKLAEGVRVVDFAEDGDIDDRDFNEIEDQLAGMLGPLAVAAPIAAAACDTSIGTLWHFRASLDPPYWQRSAAGSVYLAVPAGALRAGQVITAAAAVVQGDFAGGTIILQRAPNTISSNTKTPTLTWAADPWNTASAWVVKAATGGTPHTVLANYNYWFEFYTPGAGTVARVLGVYYTAQFGN